jgi:hypothetical protein
MSASEREKLWARRYLAAVLRDDDTATMYMIEEVGREQLWERISAIAAVAHDVIGTFLPPTVAADFLTVELLHAAVSE